MRLHPLDQAKSMYEEQGGCFTTDLAFYLRSGYVFSEPTQLLMIAPVKLPDFKTIVPLGEADAWYVRLAVGMGRLSGIFGKMPSYLPFVCWNRSFRNPMGALHVWPSDRFGARVRPYVK